MAALEISRGRRPAGSLDQGRGGRRQCRKTSLRRVARLRRAPLRMVLACWPPRQISSFSRSKSSAQVAGIERDRDLADALDERGQAPIRLSTASAGRPLPCWRGRSPQRHPLLAGHNRAPAACVVYAWWRSLAATGLAVGRPASGSQRYHRTVVVVQVRTVPCPAAKARPSGFT